MIRLCRVLQFEELPERFMTAQCFVKGRWFLQYYAKTVQQHSYDLQNFYFRSEERLGRSRNADTLEEAYMLSRMDSLGLFVVTFNFANTTELVPECRYNINIDIFKNNIKMDKVVLDD